MADGKKSSPKELIAEILSQLEIVRDGFIRFNIDGGSPLWQSRQYVEQAMKSMPRNTSEAAWIKQYTVKILLACAPIARAIQDEKSHEKNHDILKAITAIHAWGQKVIAQQRPVLLASQERNRASNLIGTLKAALEPRESPSIKNSAVIVGAMTPRAKFSGEFSAPDFIEDATRYRGEEGGFEKD